MAQPPHTGGKRGIVPDFWTAGITRRLEVHDLLERSCDQCAATFAQIAQVQRPKGGSSW